MKIILKIIIPLSVLGSFVSWIFKEGDQGNFVYLRGKKQYVLVEGYGEPTIVFLSGKGRTQKDFKKMYSKLRKTNQVFSYDRAGIGKSETLRNERTVDTMAFELHELLVKDQIKPPYIFVGHGMGAYISRCFINMYPNTVKGMVLLDPSHEYEFKNGLEMRSDSDKIVFIADFKSYLKVAGRTKGQNAEAKRSFDFDSLGLSTNQRIVYGIALPKDIPITVMLSTIPDADNDYIEREMEYRKTYFENWKTINTKTKVVSVPKSSYFINLDQPDKVTNEIYELIGNIEK